MRKLSVRSISWFEEVEDGIFDKTSLSGSGVGGRAAALWISSAEGGCDERGPPPAVGGRATTTGDGDLGGVSGGAGIFVPAVRETLTGVRVRKDLRRELSMFTAPRYRGEGKLG